MLTEEKLKQIKKSLRAGVPEGEIKNELRNEGYTEEDLDKIFKPHSYDMRSWYLIFAILFFIVGMYRAVADKGFLFLLFSAGMVYVYELEKKKIKNKSL